MISELPEVSKRRTSPRALMICVQEGVCWVIKDLIIPYRHLMFHTISLDMAEDSLLRILVMWMCLQFALDCTPRIWKEEGSE